jgi:outer membrane biosynthesis protein TonB
MMGSSEHPKHKTAAKEQPSDNTDPSNSRSRSTDKPPKPVSATGLEEVNVSQTEESSAEEKEQGTSKERTGEDDYMHELFGSTEEDEDVAAPEE